MYRHAQLLETIWYKAMDNTYNCGEYVDFILELSS